MHSLQLLALIWVVVFAANVLARATKLTPVLWFLALGAFMVNIGLMPKETDPFISGLSELGILLIMFAIGFEENTDNFMDSIKKSWGIAFFGALAPFTAAYLVADYYWDNPNIALMCGLTMTATAVSLTMVSLKSVGLHTSPAAIRIMTSAVLDDIASLALVAILVPVATGQGSAELVDIALIVVKAITFFVAVSILGAWLLPHKVSGWFSRVPLIGTHGMQHLINISRHSTLTVLLLALLVGLLAHEFGFHPAVGAFMAGLILKEEYFQRKDEKGSFDDTKRIIDNVAFSWIGPVFFIDLGTKLLFDWGVLSAVVPNILVLTSAVFFSQIISAALAARYTGGMNWEGSLLIGFGMLGRAELAFVVINIAYVQHLILSTEAFYTLMVSAFILNILVPITITWWKPRYIEAMKRDAEYP